MLGLIAIGCGGFFVLPLIVPAVGILTGVSDEASFTIPLLSKAEMEAVDWRIRHANPAPLDPSLVFLSVDPQSVMAEIANEDELKESRALREMTTSYPWPRSVYGLILERLAKAGAKVVIFDFLFPKPGLSDEVFRKAVEQFPDQVILKVNLAGFKVGENQGNASTVAYPTESIIGSTDPNDHRLSNANFWPDPDGIIRKAIYSITPSQAQGRSMIQGESVSLSTAGRVANRVLGHDDLTKEPGLARVFRYAGPPEATFPTHPIYEIFIPKFWERKEMFDKGAYFKDKNVMVGPSGSYFKDVLKTPWGEMNGAEVHLQSLNAALTNSFLRETTGWEELGLIVGAAFLAWLLVFLSPSPSNRFLAGLVISTVFVLVLNWLYDHLNLQVNSTVAPLLAFNCTNLFGLTYEFILERIEKARVRSTFERYVSRNVVREILDKREDFENLLGGQRKPVTILFSDIRGFTTMTESADSAALVERLNEYLTAMVKCVYKTDGTLDKFIGDAVMAVWGNVVSVGVKEDGVHAIDTALEMLRELRRMNEIWVAKGLAKWEIGIGLNHGEVIVGNMGASEKMEFTVIGDPVNLASRLESLTKEYGLELIIGETLATLVRESYHLQSVDLVAVKGKTKPVEVFAVLGPASEVLPEPLAKYQKAFNEGVRLFRAQKFMEALEKFKETEVAKPGDYLSIKVYQPRCIELAENPPGSGWDGVHRMKNK